MHMAERLSQILDHFEIARAHLCGFDMGGQPTLVFAAMHRERCVSLTVMNSLVYGDSATSWEIALLRKFRFNRVALRHFPKLIFHRAEQTFLPSGVNLPEALRQDLWEAFRRPEVRRYISKMCAGYQGYLPRVPALYEIIQCPTLTLWAEEDKHFPRPQAEELHRAIAASKLMFLPDAGHWMPWYRAPEVASEIERFLAAL